MYIPDSVASQGVLRLPPFCEEVHGWRETVSCEVNAGLFSEGRRYASLEDLTMFLGFFFFN